MRLLPEVPTRAALNRRHGDRFKWLALLVVGLGTIAAVLATTSFNVAVPALSKHFGLGQDQVQWAITGFLAALTVAMLPTPWLLDQVGFRRLFLGANLMLGMPMDASVVPPSRLNGSVALPLNAPMPIAPLNTAAAPVSPPSPPSPPSP